jgi:hypothetical protein
MTPEEQAKVDADLAAARSAAPVIDYTKLMGSFDYTKLAAAMPKPAAPAADDQAKKDADAAEVLAAEAQRVKDADIVAKGGTVPPPVPPKWDPKESPEFKKMQFDLDANNKRTDERERKAELKERSGFLKLQLSNFDLQESAKNDAFKLILNDLKLAADGETYVGPGGEPAEQYIATKFTTDYDYMLKPKDVGGSGARNGGARKDAAIDIDSIKVGMKPDAREAARAEINRVLAGARN